MEQLFGGGFAIASCEAYYGDLELPAVMIGQVLQGFQYIFDQEIPGVTLRDHTLIIYDNRFCSYFQGLGSKAVGVKVGAFQSKK